MWWLITIGSLLPIWRFPPYQGGYNVWQMWRLHTDRPHVTAEEAIERAKSMYQQGHFDNLIRS